MRKELSFWKANFIGGQNLVYRRQQLGRIGRILVRRNPGWGKIIQFKLKSAPILGRLIGT